MLKFTIILKLLPEHSCLRQPEQEEPLAQSWTFCWLPAVCFISWFDFIEFQPQEMLPEDRHSESRILGPCELQNGPIYIHLGRQIHCTHCVLLWKGLCHKENAHVELAALYSLFRHWMRWDCPALRYSASSPPVIGFLILSCLWLIVFRISMPMKHPFLPSDIVRQLWLWKLLFKNFLASLPPRSMWSFRARLKSTNVAKKFLLKPMVTAASVTSHSSTMLRREHFVWRMALSASSSLMRMKAFLYLQHETLHMTYWIKHSSLFPISSGFWSCLAGLEVNTAGAILNTSDLLIATSWKKCDGWNYWIDSRQKALRCIWFL